MVCSYIDQMQTSYVVMKSNLRCRKLSWNLLGMGSYGWSM